MNDYLRITVESEGFCETGSVNWKRRVSGDSLRVIFVGVC